MGPRWRDRFQRLNYMREGLRVGLTGVARSWQTGDRVPGWGMGSGALVCRGGFRSLLPLVLCRAGAGLLSSFLPFSSPST